MIKNLTVNSFLNPKNSTTKSLNIQNEVLNPSEESINFLLAYSKALSVKKSKKLGDIFEIKN